MQYALSGPPGPHPYLESAVVGGQHVPQSAVVVNLGGVRHHAHLLPRQAGPQGLVQGVQGGERQSPAGPPAPYPAGTSIWCRIRTGV